MAVNKLKVLLVLLLFGGLVVGCATGKHLRLGDELLGKGDLSGARAAYRQALKVSPENERAKNGIVKVRVLAVRTEVDAAKQAVAEFRYADGLRRALRARRLRLPVGKAIDLRREVDTVAVRAIEGAERSVAQMLERGKYPGAVALAKAIVESSAGLKSRQEWAAEVTTRAQVEYQKRLSSARAAKKRLGEFFYLAMLAAAKDESPQKLTPKSGEGLLSALGRACPTSAAAKVKVDSGVGLGKRKRALQARLDVLLKARIERCLSTFGGVGRGAGGDGDEVQITVLVRSATEVDEDLTERRARPFPGEQIDTFEVYFEEQPYIAIEDVTEMVERTEKVERRDCAPRPGKPRGCVTWVEDVTVEVPTKVKREVEKIRKIERRRTIPDLPTDKVLYYNHRSVQRGASISGALSDTSPRARDLGLAERLFSLQISEQDEANDEITSSRMTIAADPLEIKTTDEVWGAVGGQLETAVEQYFIEIMARRVQDLQARALELVVAGDVVEAVELTLAALINARLLDDDGAIRPKTAQRAERFFADHFGLGAEGVYAALDGVVGRQLFAMLGGTLPTSDAVSGRDSGVPTRVGERQTDNNDKGKKAAELSKDEDGDESVPGAVIAEDRAPVSGFEDLEGGSLDDLGLDEEPLSGDDETNE